MEPENTFIWYLTLMPHCLWMGVHIATLFTELFLFKVKFISRLFQVPSKYL